MSLHIWPAAWHGRIAIAVSGIAAVVSLQLAADFGQIGEDAAIDTNAILVITVVCAAAIGILLMSGHHLDRRHPTSSFGEALLRLFIVIVVLLAASGRLMNSGIFASSDFAFLGVAIVSVGAVLITRLVFATVGRPGEPPSGDPGHPQRPPHVRPGHPQHPSYVDPATGGPRWPDAPPIDAPPTAPPSIIGPASAVVERERAISHRITSGVITVAWLPLGLLFLFVANYCPNEGTADAVGKTSVVFVAVQLLGNPVAGWLLDRHYGNRGGPLLAIGRAVLAAVVLMFVAGWTLMLFVPDGASRYCG